MSTGIYQTTDPDKRIRVVFDDEFPTEDPSFPYAPGVLDDLIQCYEEGNYYGVIVEEREVWQNKATGVIWEDWKQVESIWSCAGYDDVAAEVAKEFFGLTVVKD